MIAGSLVLAASLVGIDTGWQKLDDGSMEYIIQIEPELLKSLEDGDEIFSELRGNLKSVRRYRIVVGDQALPRDEPPAAEPVLDNPPAPPVAERPVEVEPAVEAQTNDPPAFQIPPVRPAFSDSPDASEPFRPNPGPPEPAEPAAEPLSPGPPATEAFQMPDRYAAPPVLDETPAPASFPVESNRIETFKQTAAVGPVVSDDVAPPVPVASKPVSKQPSRPWFALALIGALLAGSLAANVYLVSQLMATRRRFFAVVRQRDLAI